MALGAESDLIIAGHRAHLEEVGTGDPVLLLHSGGLSGTQWRRLVERLRGSHRVLVPDFLGMGASEPWPAGESFHFSLDVDLAVAVLERAGAPAHVVGHSYGGLIALQLALRAPAKVRSLSLCEPVAFGVLPPGDPGLAELAATDHDGAHMDLATGGDPAWLEWFINYWNGAGSWQRLPAPQREAFLRVGRKLFLEVHSLNLDPTPASAYAAAIRCPTLLLSGTKSTVAANRVCEVLAAAIPGARHEVLEGATHMAPVVDAARVNEKIAAHLGG